MIYEPEGLRATTVIMVDRRDVLLATAVIQFANDEIRLSEQRIDEARVNALAKAGFISGVGPFPRPKTPMHFSGSSCRLLQRVGEPKFLTTG